MTQDLKHQLKLLEEERKQKEVSFNFAKTLEELRKIEKEVEKIDEKRNKIYIQLNI